MIIDNQPPTASLTPPAPPYTNLQNGTPIFKTLPTGEFTITINDSDLTANVLGSGLKVASIKARVGEEDKTDINSVPLTSDSNIYKEVPTEGLSEGDIKNRDITTSDASGNKFTLTQNGNSLADANGITLNLTAEDLAGNKVENGSLNYTFSIDNTAPEVTVSFGDDSAKVTDNKYFPSTRTATITVYDANPGSNAAGNHFADLFVQYNGASEANIATSGNVAGTFNTSNTISAWSVPTLVTDIQSSYKGLYQTSATLTFIAEGTYELRVTATDSAANTTVEGDVTYDTQSKHPKDFVIDKTLPTIKLSRESSAPTTSTTATYNSYTIKAEATDVNFDTETSVVGYTHTGLPGATVFAPPRFPENASAWETSGGDVYSATLPVASPNFPDGEYDNFDYVTIKDLAGNAAIEFVQNGAITNKGAVISGTAVAAANGFVIDNVGPVVNITLDTTDNATSPADNTNIPYFKKAKFNISLAERATNFSTSTETLLYRHRTTVDDGLPSTLSLSFTQVGATSEFTSSLTIGDGGVQGIYDSFSIADIKDGAGNRAVWHDESRIKGSYWDYTPQVPGPTEEAIFAPSNADTTNGETANVSKGFVIDHTAPQIAVTYTNWYSNLSYEDGDYRYYQQRGVSLVVTDQNFNKDHTVQIGEDDAALAVNEETIARVGDAAANATGIATTYTNAELVAGLHSFNFDNIADKAGNKVGDNGTVAYQNAIDDGTGTGDNDDDTFYVDSTVPTAGLALNDLTQDTSSAWDLYNKSLITNDKVAASISGADADSSGVYRIEHFTVAPEAVDLSANWDTLYAAHNGSTNTSFASLSEGTPASFVHTFNSNDRFIFGIRVIDRSGRVDYLLSDGVIIDQIVPRIVGNVALTGPSAGGVFTGEVTASITVTDNDPGRSSVSTGTNGVTVPVSSGLASVAYDILKNGASIGTAGTVANPSRFEELSGSPTWQEIVDASRETTYSVRIPANATYNQNNLAFTAEVSDTVGNVSGHTTSAPFAIDTIAPEVTAVFDNNNALNDRYFKAARRATITVFDRNYNPNALDIYIPDGGTIVSKDTVAGSITSNDTDKTPHTIVIAFTSENDYRFGVAAADQAGNGSGGYEATSYTGAATRDFVIDLTAPTITVSYDNNDVRNGKYFNAARAATIAIDEHNFRGSDVVVTATRDGAAVAAGGFNDPGDAHSAVLNASLEGDYALEVAYTDLAGNEATQISYTGAAAREFTVDTTAPVVEFSDDVADHKAYNDVVEPVVTLTDRNYDGGGKQISVTGVKTGAGNANVSYAVITDGERGTIVDLAHTPENDDIYTVSAELTDLAGNSSDATLTYSVNRFGSTWLIDGATKALVDGRYAQAAPDVVIHEINVNEVSEYSISFAHGGNLTTLDDSDYSVGKTGGDSSWHENTYTIDATNFGAEGLYEVTVSSTDSAGNSSSNRAPRVQDSAAPVDFIVDATPPTLVITGIEDGGSYATEVLSAVIDAEDNIALESVEVYLNDASSPSATFTAEQFESNGGKVNYDISASGERQKVSVRAFDRAGNEKEALVVENIFVNPDGFLQLMAKTPLAVFVDNPPILYAITGGTAVVVVGGAAAGAVAFFRRRRLLEAAAKAVAKKS